MIWLVILKIAVYAAFIPLMWQAGNRFCRLVLDGSGAQPGPKASPAEKVQAAETSPANNNALAAGRYIGSLERTLIAAGVLIDRWEIIVAVIALKTVARYKELDKQLTAEYFLIGSLASIVWAVLITLLLLFYDWRFGFAVARRLQALLLAN